MKIVRLNKNKTQLCAVQRYILNVRTQIERKRRENDMPCKHQSSERRHSYTNSSNVEFKAIIIVREKDNRFMMISVNVPGSCHMSKCMLISLHSSTIERNFFLDLKEEIDEFTIVVGDSTSNLMQRIFSILSFSHIFF